MPYRTEHRFKAMGGPCTLLIDSSVPLEPNVLLGLEAEIERLEQKYSRYRADSLVSRINTAAGSGGTVAIDSETAGLCHYMDQLYRESDGLFDPTSGILRRAWNFASGTVPADETIAALLPLIDWPSVHWTDSELALPTQGMELDLGGLVKEYAVDCGIRYLSDRGITHALFDMAGDLATLGTQGDGRAWPISIKHPRDTQMACVQLPLSDQRLASSGDYERCMIVDGERYSHHLDPRTGMPVRGLLAVSVVGDQCMVAGSIATVAMLKSSAGTAFEWLESSGLAWCAVDADLYTHGPLTQA